MSGSAYRWLAVLLQPPGERPFLFLGFPPRFFYVFFVCLSLTFTFAFAPRFLRVFCLLSLTFTLCVCYYGLCVSRPQLSGAEGVVSCVGGFGSNEHMEKLCGDATVLATEAAGKV